MARAIAIAAARDLPVVAGRQELDAPKVVVVNAQEVRAPKARVRAARDVIRVPGQEARRARARAPKEIAAAPEAEGTTEGVGSIRRVNGGNPPRLCRKSGSR